MINSKSACIEQEIASKDKLIRMNLEKLGGNGKSESIQNFNPNNFNSNKLHHQYSDEENKIDDSKIIIKIPKFKNRKSLCAPTMVLPLKNSKFLFCSFNSKTTPNILKRKSLTPVTFYHKISKYFI